MTDNKDKIKTTPPTFNKITKPELPIVEKKRGNAVGAARRNK